MEEISFLKDQVHRLNAVLAKYQEKFPSAGAEISRSVSEIDTTTAWTNDKTFLPALLAEYDSIIQDQEKVINNYQETLGDQRQRTDQLVRENTRLNRELKDAVQQQVENPHGVDPHAVASGGVASSADLDILYNVQQQLHTAVQEKETAVDLWQTAVGEIDHIRSQLQNEKDSHSWKVIENQAHKVQEQYMQTVSELNAEITNLQSDLRKTRTELTASHLQISDLEKIIDELKHHLQWKEQEHADTAFKEGISDSKMSDFKHRIEDLQQKLIDSEHELSKATGHNSMFEFKVAELQKKCSEFERREFDAVVQVRDSVQVVENAMLEKDEIEIKLKQKEEELIQLQATINQLINEAGARTRKEVDNVRKQCNDNIEKLMDELHVLEMDNGEKQAQLDRLLREKRAVESELEKIYKEGSTQGAKDRGSYEDMNRRAVNAERLKDETDMKVDTLDRNLKMEQMNRNQEKQQMQTEIGNLKERLINVEQEFEVTNDDKLKYLSEIDTLKRKILDAQKDRDAAVRKCNKQMSILSQDKDLQLKEYEAKLQSTEDANRQALTKLRELLGGQQRMSARWKEECSGMTSKFESKITDSRLEVENLRKRNDELASVLRAHQTKTAEAERLISEYNQKIHRLEDRVRETESRASQATKQLSHQSLRQRNGAMDPDLEHAFTAANNFMQRRHMFNRSRLSAVNGRNDHAGSRSPSIHSDHENGINGVDADIDDLLLSDR